MAGRKIILAEGEYYHIFNRGIARQPVFFTKRDYERFILALSYYRFAKPPTKLSNFMRFPREIQSELLNKLNTNNEKLVEIVSYVLMPNHFHILLKQLTKHGISIFLSKLINSYTRYINTKQDRVGDLFQGVFKAVHVETDNQLLHLSRYIHLNPVVSYITKEAELISYPWSSFSDYIAGNSEVLNLDLILGNFKAPYEYQKFVLDQIDYANKLEEIKHLMIER